MILRCLFFFVLATSLGRALPNIVLIVADDLGWHDLTCTGATDLSTPTIDILAQSGVRCTNAYVTSPVCSPSRAGILTGRYQQRFGHETNPGTSLEHSPFFGLPQTERTMADRFKALNYATGWTGKSHLGWQPPYRPNQRGFDYFFGFLESHHGYLNASSSQWNHDPIRENDTVVTLAADTYLTNAFASKAVQFINDHQGGPFFLYVPFNGIHFPLQSNEDLQTRCASLPISDPTRRTMAEVLLGVDDGVKAILLKLAQCGIANNTIVIFTSDNGGDTSSENAAHNEPLKGGKTQLYEGGIRVPFIMSWPGHIPANTFYNKPVSTLDILPTCLKAAGVQIPRGWQLDGTDLMPYLTGQNTGSPHEFLFWRVETDGQPQGANVFDGVRAVRWGNWKLVKPRTDATWELYDLSTPTGLSEDENLANTRPDIVATMVTHYEAWAAEMARGRWAVDDLQYPTPEHILEDIALENSVSVPNITGQPHTVPGSTDTTVISGGQIARQSGSSVVTLTTDPGTKTDAWAVQVPELGGELCYAAVVDHTSIGLYQNIAGNYTRIATLTLPPTAATHFIYSMRPVVGQRGFNGVSWFTCSGLENDLTSAPGLTEVWLLGIGPDASHQVARRLDEAGGTNHALPQTVLSDGEVLCYYKRGTQNRLARTGLVQPDATTASGLSQLGFTPSFAATPASALSHGTETTHLVVHEGKVFAGVGNRGTSPLSSSWKGAQILLKPDASSSWQEETSLTVHERVEALKSVTFTLEGSTPLGTPQSLLVAAFSDITSVGGGLVGTRTRMSPGNWQHSEILELSGPAEPVSLGLHTNTVSDPDVQNIFAGLSNGEIHRGEYRATSPGKIAWVAAEHSGSGEVTAFAEANGVLFASMNGVYQRSDTTLLWSPVYQPPLSPGVITGLTNAPDPRGTENQVLLFARSSPGTIERLDPLDGNRVVVELDVRDFFARQLGDDALRTASVQIGYQPFTPVTDPVTGKPMHLIGVWFNVPALGTQFIIRHDDATYERAGVELANLRATRCMVPSPFSSGTSVFFGGYDVNGESATDTAWIAEGQYQAWPRLTLDATDPPYLQLNWPAVGLDWMLESTTDFTTWTPVASPPTRSLQQTTLSLLPGGTRGFFRLRKP